MNVVDSTYFWGNRDNAFTHAVWIFSSYNIPQSFIDGTSYLVMSSPDWMLNISP